MRKIIFTGLLLASMVGCQSDDGTQVLNTNDGPAVNFTLIGKNSLYGNGAENIEENNFVINDNQAWQELLDKMTTVNSLPFDFGDTNIDFSQYTVIAIFDEVRPSAGYSVEVASVIEGDGTVVVDVENDDPGSGAAATVMTQPFHIVKIQKTTLPITFD